MTDALRVARTFVCMALVTSIVVAAGCQRPAMVHVPMQYRPTGSMETGAISGGLPAGQSLAVTVTDSRTDRTAIGTNVEKEGAAVPVYAEGNPDRFVREAVSRELGNVGLTVASDPSQAKRDLHIDLRRFWTEESSLYHGTVTANVELRSASGKVLWQGLTSGTSKRFGRSLSPENYQEAFSDATMNMVENLLKNGDFLTALRAPEPTAAPPAGGRKGKPRR